MQFIDLKAQYLKIQANIDKRIRQVFEHSQYIMGPEVEELEAHLAEYVGAKHCITVASGTDALLFALMALGIKAGDEVITTPFSFIATATMTKLLGAKPVFVDIDPITYNIDVNLIKQAITPRTKAIMPVNLYGQCADYDAIHAIADQYGLYVIEDAAQSFGATYKGRPSCNLGTIGCTSFYPSKPLGCYGDGGACFTQDDELAVALRRIRNHGQDRSYHHVCMGVNGRFDTIQAAILLAKLEIFPTELQQRKQVAQQYDSLLADQVIIPHILDHNQSSYAQYTIQVQDRDQVIQALSQQHIPTAVHYPAPIHQQPLMVQLNGSDHYELPHAEAAARHVLSLPFHPYLSEGEVARIASVVIQTVKTQGLSEQVQFSTSA